MLNKSMKSIVVIISMVLLPMLVLGQTAQWRLMWDKNLPSDSVSYYVVYRNIGSAPTLSDSIGMQPEPSNPAEQFVIFVDNGLQTGNQYFYRVQAVDYMHRRSSLSSVVDESIPKVLINSVLQFKINSTIQYNLNESKFVSYPGYPNSDLGWSVTGGNQITIQVNSSTNIATIQTPADSTITEAFTFLVENPEGFNDSKTIAISLTGFTVTPPPPPPPPPPPGSEMVSSFSWSSLGASIISISWETREDTKDYIIYGLNGDLSESTVKDVELSSSHEQIISQLLPDTEYQFQIVSEDAQGVIHTSSVLTFTVENREKINVFPIPYNANTPPEYEGIYFDIPASSVSYKLSIYTSVGDLVFTTSDLRQSYVWKVVNSSGREVNAGLYIYHIVDESDNQIDTGKLVVIR